jgi:DNA-directed RNA polymerase subunit M/transcription elongation factor TFIIS
MKPRKAKGPALKTTLYTCPKCGKAFRTHEVVKG